MYIVYRTLGTTRKSIAVAPPVGVTIRSTTVAEGCTKPTSTARSKRSRTCTTRPPVEKLTTRSLGLGFWMFLFVMLVCSNVILV